MQRVYDLMDEANDEMELLNDVSDYKYLTEDLNTRPDSDIAKILESLVNTRDLHKNLNKCGMEVCWSSHLRK